VATDLRLYLRGEVDRLLEEIDAVQRSLVEVAAAHTGTVMPGYTHLAGGPAVTVRHHLLAYVEMLERDRERLVDARGRMNRLPLGSAALAGTTFPIDRSGGARSEVRAVLPELDRCGVGPGLRDRAVAAGRC